MPPAKIEIIDGHTAEWMPVVRTMFLQYADWLKIDLCFQGFDQELQMLPGDYAPPDGRLILARSDDDVAGCVALRRWSCEIGEMKRLYVRDEFRGMGIGKRLILKIIDEAGAIGFKSIRLDTLPMMGSAIGLYRALGFKEIAPYRENPVPGALYFELKLSD